MPRCSKAFDYKYLEKKYGEEFAKWAEQNKNKIQTHVLNAGCKTGYEYRNKNAQKLGFKDHAERTRDRSREYCYDKGIYGPASENEYCASYFGVHIAEKYIMKTFEDPIQMPLNNPGFDWICKKGYKIDSKAACLNYHNKNPSLIFPIRYNNIADYFILSGWDNRESLQPICVWIFHKDDIVRGKKFWKRDTITITNTPEGLKQFEKYEVTNRLDKLKELCDKKR